MRREQDCGERHQIEDLSTTMFCAAVITCIYSPVMTMFTHREKRQKHKDKTASSAIHELPNTQTDKLSRDERASVMKRIVTRLIISDV